VNVKGKVLATKIVDGKMLMKCQLDGKLPKVGDHITVKFGKIRSLSQNSLYWVFLQWLIDNGLRDMGHFDAMALHMDFKAYFLSEKNFDRGQIKAIEEATTTTMDKLEFGQYMDSVNQLVIESLGMDTSPFWATHERDYAN